MPAKKESKINLLPQKEFERSTLGRILKWAVSSFRIIVIITEMIVMGAFLSRFWLDANNSDLNDAITQKKVVIASYAETESKFRTFQKQIDIFNKIASSAQKSVYLNLITSLAPTDVILNSVSDNDNSIQIIGYSGNEQSISQFIKNLSSNNKFKDVSLNKIDPSEDNPSAIVFTIKADVSEI
jgi:Tfp pilus assembly protein PilN